MSFDMSKGKSYKPFALAFAGYSMFLIVILIMLFC